MKIQGSEALIKCLLEEDVDIIFNLKLKGLKVESLSTWFENEFHRIPTHTLANN